MDPIAVYSSLMAAASGDLDDAHVVASSIAMAVQEMQPGRTFTAGLGIAGQELRQFIAAPFPDGVRLLERFGLDEPAFPSEDELCLRELLSRFATTGTWLELRLADLIARRSLRPNHLWQDLGLRNRGELSRLMTRHFARLAARNNHDMKWKKFFYRMICRDEGYSLCTAPSCSECCDFEVCFGDESGESLMARVRREAEIIPGARGLINIDLSQL